VIYGDSTIISLHIPVSFINSFVLVLDASCGQTFVLPLTNQGEDYYSVDVLLLLVDVLLHLVDVLWPLLVSTAVPISSG
jgi:hypothetical protein